MLATWRAWDDRPAQREQVVRLQSACTQLASRLGVSTLELRRRMAAGRRTGFTYEAVLAGLCTKLVAGSPNV